MYLIINVCEPCFIDDSETARILAFFAGQGKTKSQLNPNYSFVFCCNVANSYSVLDNPEKEVSNVDFSHKH